MARKKADKDRLPEGLAGGSAPAAQTEIPSGAERASTQEEGVNAESAAAPKFSRPTGAPRQVKEVTKEVPLWEAHIELMKKKGTMPRDIFDRNPLGVKIRSSEAADYFFDESANTESWETKMIPGVPWDLYQPVTDKEIRAFGLRCVSDKRNDRGEVMGPTDTKLAWIPKALKKQWSDMQRERAQRRHKGEERAMAKELGAVGGGTVQGSELEVAAAAAAEMKKFKPIPGGDINLEIPDGG